MLEATCARTRFWMVLLALAAALAAQRAAAQGADDRAALAGLTEVKVAFDITAGDGKALLGRLNTIDETRLSLIRQGIRPDFVLTFRGPATRLLQTDMSKVKPEDRELAKRIAAKIEEMSKATGVHGIEQCSVAMRLQEVRAEDVLPQVKVVGNSWISLAAYQAKGYGYIAP